MPDLRLFFPGQLSWLAQAVEETELVGPLSSDGDSLFEWCEGEAIELPVRINLTRSKREGEQEIASPVYVRMFTRFDEPVEESALSSFAHRLAHALARYAHSAIDVGTMSYQGGEDFSFAVGESIPAR